MMHDPQFSAQFTRQRRHGRRARGALRALACCIRSHAVGRHATYNQGFGFSSCRRCGCDMIRSDSYPAPTDWKPVPPGFKIIWCDRYTAARAAASEPVPEPMLWRQLLAPAMLRDLFSIAGAAFAWCVRDAVATPVRFGEVVRELR